MSMLLNVTHQGFNVKEFKIVAIATISNFSNVHHAPASSYLQLVSSATRNTRNSSDTPYCGKEFRLFNSYFRNNCLKSTILM